MGKDRAVIDDACAQRSGCNFRPLRRYRAYAHRRGVQRIDQLREEIRQIATNLHSEGVDPTHRRVAALLRHPGRLRERVARTSLQEVRQELAWKD